MECAVRECHGIRNSRGLCRKHYEKAKRDGVWPACALAPTGGRQKKAPCKHCGKISYARGLCYLHYERQKDGRKMLGPKRGTTGPIVTPQGYRAQHIGGGKYKLEHRIVMERLLGRPLYSHETVHHINGVRADNSPENLELWSSSHPPGQRVIDKLTWARGLIKQYEGLDL